MEIKFFDNFDDVSAKRGGRSIDRRKPVNSRPDASEIEEAYVEQREARRKRDKLLEVSPSQRDWRARMAEQYGL